MRSAQVVRYLSEHDIKPSNPRVRVMEYLMSTKSHPTIDEIYGVLSGELPTLSKTTVYNTLDLFVRKNVAKLITIDQRETRYDADVSAHGHFRCEECGRVYDFGVNLDGVQAAGLERFKVTGREVYYRGLCPNCLSDQHK